MDLTLSTPEQNLACEEGLLEACESGQAPELLRFWEPREYFVVAGYANRLASTVDLAACHRLGFPILRRCSGGGTVLQGPGCLNYALFLSWEKTGHLAGITETNSFVMREHAKALAPLLGTSVSVQGTIDLTLGARKFSGNAQRRKRRFILFHGTFLLHFDLALVASVLPQPEQQPAYRENRPHSEFLTNLQIPAQAIKDALARHWHATEQWEDIPYEVIDQLVRNKYSQHEWNYMF